MTSANGYHKNRTFVMRALLVTASAVVPVGGIALFMRGTDLLYREDGILEDISVVLWGLSVALSIVISCSRIQARDRAQSGWLGLLALLAMLRELDMQIYLNPQKLGHWGVRYRIDWWLNGDIDISPKLLWAAVFLILATALSWVPLRNWRRWVSCLKELHPAIVLIMGAVILLGVGAAIDDLLRKAKFIPLPLRQLCEETSETCGAAWYLAGAFFAWRKFRKNAQEAEPLPTGKSI